MWTILDREYPNIMEAMFEPRSVSGWRQLFDHNSSQVVVNGRKSNPFFIEAGVLQGSVLSPCLYSIFIDEAPVYRTILTVFWKILIVIKLWSDFIVIFMNIILLLSKDNIHKYNNRLKIGSQNFWKKLLQTGCYKKRNIKGEVSKGWGCGIGNGSSDSNCGPDSWDRMGSI